MSSFFRQVDDSDSSADSSDLEEELTDSSFGSGSDDSEMDSDSDAGSDSDDGNDDDDNNDSDAPKAPRGSRFLRDADSDSDDSDSDDDRAKVVKSAKSKRQEEIDSHIKTIENSANINDWVSIQTEFDKLTRIVQRDASLGQPIPGSYLRIFGVIQDALNAPEKPKMNATNARALNSMKQRLRKLTKEYQSALDEYKKDPEAYDARIEEASKPATASATPAGGNKKSASAKKSGAASAAADDDDDGFQQVGPRGKAVQISTEGIFKTLEAVLEARGRKNTDLNEQIHILYKLARVAQSTYQKIRVNLAIIAALLDYSPSTNAYMSLDHWREALNYTESLVALLKANPEYQVRETAPDYDELVERSPSPEEPVIIVRGSLASLLERLDDEFTKSLQNIDPHSDDYVNRLRDEKPLYTALVTMTDYLDHLDSQNPASKTGTTHESSSSSQSAPKTSLTSSTTTHSNAASTNDRLAMRRLDHVYAKPDSIVAIFEKALPEGLSLLPKDQSTNDKKDSKENGLVRALCARLYKASSAILRTRALLFHIYHLASRGNFYDSRDMMLMSHLQDTIFSADVTTQILYNRAIVQLGLAAFRNGLIRESQAVLHDIFATQRVRELLAQGVQPQRYTNLTSDQDKIERSRQLPFHLHINLDLLECVYLVSSMLLEVPQMALAGSDPEARKRVLSRTFRRMLDFTDRQIFVGPPENKRDHIMQAAKALQFGQWRLATDLVTSIKVWQLMDDEQGIKEMLSQKIHEEGLRTYLLTHGSYYGTISIEYLAETFELTQDQTRALIAKAIWNDELKAALDQVSNVVVIKQANVSSIQAMSLALADKTSQLAEQSERYLDSKIQPEQRQERGNVQVDYHRNRFRAARPAHRGAYRQFSRTLGRSLA